MDPDSPTTTGTKTSTAPCRHERELPPPHLMPRAEADRLADHSHVLGFAH
eukprot:COSAG04_NODE_24224_length_325_cov_0.676991_1_plen_49_part_01